jgi:hypothetical protein
MAWWTFIIGNIYILLLFRALLLAVGLLELFRLIKKNSDIEVKFSWKPAPIQEAISNVFMIGALIIVFILIVWLDYSQSAEYFGISDFNLYLIPVDILLGLFVIIIHVIPKRFVIAEEGYFYSGEMTPWGDVIDYTIKEKKGVLTLKHWRKFFTFSFRTETQVPLPEDKKGMEEALEIALGRKKEKKKKGKKGKGKKKDLDEEDVIDKKPKKPSKGKKGKEKEQDTEKKSKGAKKGKGKKK